MRLYASLPLFDSCRTWAEVDLSALRENWRILRRTMASGGSCPRMIAVVKADGYCHGAAAVVDTLSDEGCDFFAVSCLEEADAVRRALRERARDADILVLGYTFAAHARLLSELDLVQTVLSEEYARELSRAAEEAGVVVRVHIKLDTGMNRIGVRAGDPGAAADAVARICALPGLCAEGLFTHFATADEADGDCAVPGLYRRLFDAFRAVVSALAARGIRLPLLHASNSASALRSPEFRLDAVRLGIALYGIYPSPLFGSADTGGVPLRPVMRLRTRVVHLHTLPAGETVSYGAHVSFPDDRLIATVPIGYADGFLRGYTGATVTLTSGGADYRVPVVGNVCMDQCMLDVTGVPAAVGDLVTIFGGAPEELPELAARAGTIPYEALCVLSARIPLIYRNHEGNTNGTAN